MVVVRERSLATERYASGRGTHWYRSEDNNLTRCAPGRETNSGGPTVGRRVRPFGLTPPPRALPVRAVRRFARRPRATGRSFAGGGTESRPRSYVAFVSAPNRTSRSRQGVDVVGGSRRTDEFCGADVSRPLERATTPFACHRGHRTGSPLRVRWRRRSRRIDRHVSRCPSVVADQIHTRGHMEEQSPRNTTLIVCSMLPSSYSLEPECPPAPVASTPSRPPERSSRSATRSKTARPTAGDARRTPEHPRSSRTATH